MFGLAFNPTEIIRHACFEGHNFESIERVSGAGCSERFSDSYEQAIEEGIAH